MIDIHNHILPMVDDGFQSVEASLDMLERAYRDGTDAFVLTPHLAYSYGFINSHDKISSLFDDFQAIVQQEQLPIDLYLGCEYLFDSPESFLEHLEDITTINRTPYLLIEFFFDALEDDLLIAIDTLLSHQLIPIIAHPERYECLQISPTLAKQCVEKGAFFQMNKGSVFGKYGQYAKETILDMLDQHLIHFIGSDAHHPYHRNALMYDDYCYICDHYGETYAKAIFKTNPQKMLKGEEMMI